MSTTRLHRALCSAGLCLAALAPQLALAADTDALPRSDGGTNRVEVQGHAERLAARAKMAVGALGDRADVDTPFSTRAITSEEMEDRQVLNLGEVFKYDASVVSASSAINEHPATLSVRGLRLDNLNGYKIDGLANVNRGTELPLEMFERVEVLKGLAGFLYGFGAPGGVANYITKRPTDDRMLSLAVGYDERSLLKQQLDAGGRWGENARFGYRVNLVHQDGDTRADQGAINRNALGVALDARLTPDLVLNLDTLYQHRRSVGGTGISTGNGFDLPRPLPGDTRLNSDGVVADSTYQLASLSLAYQMAEHWRATLALRHSDSVLVNKKDQLLLKNSAGDYNDSITASYQKYAFNQWQALLEGKFQTGSLSHQVVLGGMVKQLRSDKPDNNPKVVVGSSNLYAPRYYTTDSVNYSGTLFGNDKTSEAALFASDTISLNAQWSTLLGLRYTDYRDDSKKLSTAPTVSFAKSPLSPTVALMYKPEAHSTGYVSYAESLEQSASAPATVKNFDASFPPIKSRQTELGFKTEQAAWRASTALFRIERGAQYTNAANVFVQDGISVNQGLELNGSWQASKQLMLEASALKLRSTVTQAAPSVVGKRPWGALSDQAGLQVSYHLPWVHGLSLRGGLQHVGRMTVDSANVHELPAYTLFDAGLNYRSHIADRLVTWRANVTNLSNKAYWMLYQENALNVGAPRTLSLSVRVDL